MSKSKSWDADKWYSLNLLNTGPSMLFLLLKASMDKGFINGSGVRLLTAEKLEVVRSEFSTLS